MKRARATLVGLLAVLTVSAGVFGVRIVQLQVAPGEQLEPYLRVTRRTARVPTPRGDIRDRRGRVLAMTAFSWRAFVDPERIDLEAMHETIVELAEATGEPAGDVGTRIVEAVEANAAAEEAGGPVRRYVRIGGVLDDDRAALVRAIETPGVHLERVPVREYPAGIVTAALVGKVGAEHEGRLGIEAKHESTLSGASGRLRYTHDDRGEPLWIEPGDLTLQKRGEDVVLSVDLEVQRIAMEELSRRVEECDAAGGRVVLLDPVTGDVLAMGDVQRDVETVEFPWVPHDEWEERRNDGAPPRTRYAAVPRDERRDEEPALARNRCLEDVYEPGSTFKPIVWAAAYDAGVFEPDDEVETHMGLWKTPYGRRVPDVKEMERMTWSDVLFYSSNIAMVKAGMGLRFDELRDVVTRFGFGRKTGLEPASEAAGLVTPMSRWNDYTHTSVSYGHEIAVTPIQMARAFSVFARPGDLLGTLPGVSLVMAGPGEVDVRRSVRRRVVSREAAWLVREPLTRKAEEVDSRLPPKERDARRYSMFGKSGTAKIPLGAPPEGHRKPAWQAKGYFDGQYNSSFVAAAPASAPRIVVLVVIDDPGPETVRHNRYYGSSTAGPAVRRIVERVLAYQGVEPDLLDKTVAMR